MPEMLRVKGSIIASKELSEWAEAEEIFLRSLDLAREQTALSWELRTATSLALFWSRQGRLDDARAVLTPVYDRFTESFATSDLKAAKVLLDELGLVTR